jgi:Fe2+ transport system protein FeoA
MGLIPNETFSVMNYSGGGPLTVAIKGVKLAIGRGMARKIIIREVR